MYIEDDEADAYECHECGAEFTVEVLNDVDEVIFCPCCGRELYELDDDEEEDESPDNSWN